MRAAATRNDKAIALKARGIAYFYLGQNKKSIADYSRALALDLDDLFALYDRALAYENVGEHEKAIVDLGRMLEIDPENFDALYGRGKTLLDDHEFEKAIRDLDNALLQKPNDILATANRGIALAWANRTDAARADQQRLRALDAAHAAIPRISAILAYQRKDMAAAIAYLSKGLALDPTDLWSLGLRADIYWDIGEIDLAKDDDDTVTALAEQASDWQTD